MPSPSWQGKTFAHKVLAFSSESFVSTVFCSDHAFELFMKGVSEQKHFCCRLVAKLVTAQNPPLYWLARVPIYSSMR